jgi:hypothetical protein
MGAFVFAALNGRRQVVVPGWTMQSADARPSTAGVLGSHLYE